MLPTRRVLSAEQQRVLVSPFFQRCIVTERGCSEEGEVGSGVKYCTVI